MAEPDDFQNMLNESALPEQPVLDLEGDSENEQLSEDSVLSADKHALEARVWGGF